MSETYPKTMTGADGREVIIHGLVQGRHSEQRCYIVTFKGEPESYFGSAAHAASVGVEYPTILDIGKFRGLTVIHYLPDTTNFPAFAAELDRLGAWAR